MCALWDVKTYSDVSVMFRMRQRQVKDRVGKTPLTGRLQFSQTFKESHPIASFTFLAGSMASTTALPARHTRTDHPWNELPSNQDPGKQQSLIEAQKNKDNSLLSCGH